MTARCADCQRPLKRPSPSGYGPVCWRKHRPPSTSTPRPWLPTPRATRASDDQLLLDLDPDAGPSP